MLLLLINLHISLIFRLWNVDNCLNSRFVSSNSCVMMGFCNGVFKVKNADITCTLPLFSLCPWILVLPLKIMYILSISNISQSPPVILARFSSPGNSFSQKHCDLGVGLSPLPGFQSPPGLFSIFRIRDPYCKPSFATVFPGRGGQPNVPSHWAPLRPPRFCC